MALDLSFLKKQAEKAFKKGFTEYSFKISDTFSTQKRCDITLHEGKKTQPFAKKYDFPEELEQIKKMFKDIGFTELPEKGQEIPKHKPPKHKIDKHHENK